MSCRRSSSTVCSCTRTSGTTTGACTICSTIRSFRNRLLRDHLNRLSNMLHRDQWHKDVHDLRQCTAPVGPPRSSGPSGSLALLADPELPGWLALDVASPLLRPWSRQCAGLVGIPRSSARSHHELLHVTSRTAPAVSQQPSASFESSAPVWTGVSMVLSMNCDCRASKHCLGQRRQSSHYDQYVQLATLFESCTC